MQRIMVAFVLSIFSLTPVWAEDQVVKTDGRTVKGQIISEDDEAVVVLLPSGGEIRVPLSRIKDIIRDDQDGQSVEPGTADPEPEPAAPKPSESSRPNIPEPIYDSKGNKLPVVAVIPIRGQVGTDISVSVYQEMIPTLKSVQPDLVLFVVDSDDDQTVGYWNEPLKDEAGVDDFRVLNKISEVWHNEFEEKVYDLLDAMPEVACWVKNSNGPSTFLALSFCDIYMHPEAKLGGLTKSSRMFDGAKNDPDKYSKFREAVMSKFKGVLAQGRGSCGGMSPLEALLEAMVAKEEFLRIEWEGRKVKWMNGMGDAGYVVDASEEATTELTAKTANDFLVAQGQYEELDGLLFSLGLPEAQVVSEPFDDMYQRVMDAWRKAFESLEEDFQSFQDVRQGIGVDSVRQGLSQQIRLLKKIIRVIKRYEQVKIRAMGMGLRVEQLEILLEDLERQLREAAQNERNSRRSGQRSGGGSGRGFRPS